MANKFQIVISAVDRATATVRRINASMDRMTAPVRRVGQAVSALARETGITKLGQSIKGVAKSALDAVSGVSALLGPLAIIAGGGMIAGIGALATEWGRLGAEIGRSAQQLDMSADSLQALRGASRLAGAGAQELTSGLKSVGDTLEDALYGRNQQALAILDRLGVGIHKTADGSIDAARGFRDLSGAIAGIKNVQVQGLIARNFGLESLLPLLRQGPEAIEAYERKVAELGGVMGGDAVQAAGRFQLSMNYLGVATDGVRNAIGARLLPILQPLIEQVTYWISANRELIATKVAQFVEGLATWLNKLDFKKIGDDISSFAAGVDGIVDKLGGWKNAALVVVGVLNAGLLAGVINLGLALGNLGKTAIPVAIRGIGLLAAATDATLVPAVVKALLKVGLFTGGLAEMAVGVPILGTVLGGLSSAFLAVGAAIAATPVGWLLAAVAAIAASVYAIYKNWDAIGDYFSKKIADVKAAFDKGWANGIIKMLLEFHPVTIIGAALNGLSKWLFGFDLAPAGRSIVDKFIEGMKTSARWLPKSLQKMLGIDKWAATPVAVPVVLPTPASPAHGPAGTDATDSAAPARAVASPAQAHSPAQAAVMPAQTRSPAQAAVMPAQTRSPAQAAVMPAQARSPAEAAVMPKPSTAPVQTSARDPASPRGVRNNNPGNLRQWGATPRDSRGYAVFDTPEAGLDAAVKNLIAQQKLHGLSTIRSIIGKWAPPSENDTGAYVADVSRRTGLNPDQRLYLDDPKTVAPLISSIIHHEGNSANYSPEMIERAVMAQLGSQGARSQAASSQKVEVVLTVSGLPAGAAVSAQSRSGEKIPVRVAYSMPTGVTP